MARALVIAIDSRDRYIRMSDRPLQTHLAQELDQNAGVPLGPDSPCTLGQAKRFQAYLTDCQISTVSKEYGNKIIYAGPDKEKTYLYVHNDHYVM